MELRRDLPSELSAEQRADLLNRKCLTLSLFPERQTVITLDGSQALLTVHTDFQGKLQKSAKLLRALNEANKQTTTGGFIYSEHNEVRLRTTTLYFVEAGELPEPQIIDILQSHYTPAVEELYQMIKGSSR